MKLSDLSAKEYDEYLNEPVIFGPDLGVFLSALKLCKEGESADETYKRFLGMKYFYLCG